MCESLQVGCHLVNVKVKPDIKHSSEYGIKEEFTGDSED